MQFSLYIDNVIDRIDLQESAWRKEAGASERLFAVYTEQKAELLKLKAKMGDIVRPQDL
jgi:phosphoenolpyruvate carboxykinase (GTP)